MADIYKCVFRCSHANGALVQPGLHYQTDLNTPDDSEPDPHDLAQAVWDHLAAAFFQLTSDDITVHELVALQEVVPPAIGKSGNVVGGNKGLYPLAGGKLSHAMVPVVNLHTATRSRSARGWQMLGGPMREADCAGDNWDQTTAWWSMLQTYVDLLNDSLTLGTISPIAVHPVVYSRKRHHANTAPWTFHVTSATVNPQSRWLKSRLTVP